MQLNSLPLLCGRAIWTLALLINTAAAAQAPGPVNADQAAPPATIETVQSRLQQIDADAALSTEAKAKLREVYGSALALARATTNHTERLASFTSARQQAPALLATVQNELTNQLGQAEYTITNTSVQSLETLASSAEAALTAAQEKLSALKDEPKRRAERRLELPKAIAAAKANLDELTAQPAALGAEAEPKLVAAESLLRTVRQQALEAEIAAAEAELSYYEAAAPLLVAQTDRAAQLGLQLTKEVETLREQLAQSRLTEANVAVTQAVKQREELAPAGPLLAVLEKVAQENTLIAQRRADPDGVAARIGDASRLLAKAAGDLRQLRDNFTSVQRRVLTLEKAELNIDDTTGLLLRRQRASLPDVSKLLARNKARQSEISAAQLELFNLQDLRADLTDLPERAEEIVEARDARVSAEVKEEAKAAVVEFLKARRGNVEALTADYNTYLQKLTDLDVAERSLIKLSRDVGQYIDERVLWIRSAPGYSKQTLQARREALAAKFPPGGWSTLGRFLVRDARENSLTVLGTAVLLAGLAMLKRKRRAQVNNWGEQVRREPSPSFTLTLRTFLSSVAMALPIPLVFAFLGWRLHGVTEETASADFIISIGQGLLAAAIIYFTLDFYRQLCQPNGLGEAHFGWPEHNTKLARYHLRWLILSFLPFGFMVAMIESGGNEATFGQFFFIIAMVLLAVFAHCLLRPNGGLRIWTRSDAIFRRWGRAIYVIGVVIPLGLAMAAGLGFYYTTLELAWRFEATVWLIIGVILLNALVLRWFVLARRTWALEQARKRRALEAKAREASGSKEPSEPSPKIEPEIDMATVNTQTKKLIRFAVGLTLVLGLLAIWAGVFPAFTALKRVPLWQLSEPAPVITAQSSLPEGVGLDGVIAVTPTATNQTPAVSKPAKRTAVTLADLLLCLVVIVVMFAAVKNLPGLLELAVLSRLKLQPGMGYAISSVLRYVLALIGTIVAFGLLGVSWSKVQWLAAAITVGIGFGLQEIFANFVSGLIILFERPIRLGDIVTVGDISGNVTRINIRATTITDFDRREFVVPNKEFVTGKLLNWTLTDPITRVLVPVGIAYGSDVALAEKLLLKIAAESPYVMKDPPPRAIFWGFGDNSLEFRLYVHIPKRNIYLEMLHGLTTSIDREFNKAGIVIAFPQRDVHLHAAGPLEVQLARKEKPERLPAIPIDAAPMGADQAAKKPGVANRKEPVHD